MINFIKKSCLKIVVEGRDSNAKVKWRSIRKIFGKEEFMQTTNDQATTLFFQPFF
jgi:hypothetical protein